MQLLLPLLCTLHSEARMLKFLLVLLIGMFLGGFSRSSTEGKLTGMVSVWRDRAVTYGLAREACRTGKRRREKWSVCYR